MDDPGYENAYKGDETLQAQIPQQETKSMSTAFGNHDAATRRICTPALSPLLAAGFQLIPLHHWNAKDSKGRDRGKTPRDSAWQARDYDSHAVASEAERNNNNVGVRLPASVVVLDVDPRNFGDGDSLLALQLDVGLDLRGVPQTATGSGGSHYWFSKPVDAQLINSLEAYPGLEFKSSGRQVVAAGSIHPNGTEYAWATEVVDLCKLPDLPPALLNLVRRPPPKNQPVAEHEVLSCEQLEETLEQLDPTAFKDHDEWLKLMMSCHHATNGEGRQEFIDWSTGDGDYADHEWIIGQRWDSLHASGTSQGGRPITVRYLHKIVQGVGGGVPHGRPEDDFDVVAVERAPLELQLRGKKTVTSFANCMKLVRQIGGELGLAFDEFGRTVQLTAEILPWSVDVGRTLDDDVMRRIRQYLVECTGASWGKDDVSESVLTLAREKSFHPVRDYLANLTWDGVPRVDDLLVRYAGAVDSEYVRMVGAKTLIAAVRRVRKPGCKFDNVIVLEGSQGCGKSSFVKALVPNVEWFSDSPIGNTESKDAPLSLQGRWIIELGEMSVLSKSGVEALKAFVSSSIDHVRRPYGRLHEELRRQCVFIGTTNQDAYLKDQTGNRRFWPVGVGTMDIAALVADRDQLWAEAAAREVGEESLLLPQELWAAAAAEQGSRMPDDPWADKLRDWLDGDSVDGPVDAIDRIHASELLTSALGITAAKQTTG